MTSSSGNIPLTAARIHEVRLANNDLFWRQPNVHAVGEGIFQDDEGKIIPMLGIKVHVRKKVDQETLPPGDRIPRCLEGVPVQIREDKREYGEAASS